MRFFHGICSVFLHFLFFDIYRVSCPPVLFTGGQGVQTNPNLRDELW